MALGGSIPLSLSASPTPWRSRAKNGQSSPRGQLQALSQSSIFPSFRGAHWIGSRPLRGAMPYVSLSAKSAFPRVAPPEPEFNFREALVRLAYCMDYPPL